MMSIHLRWRSKSLHRMALKAAVSKCSPVILEPMMKVEVVILKSAWVTLWVGRNILVVTCRRYGSSRNAWVVRAYGSTF